MPIEDGTNNVVWILEPATLEVVDYFGRLGKNAGQFYRLHNLAVNSCGNLQHGSQRGTTPAEV